MRFLALFTVLDVGLNQETTIESVLLFSSQLQMPTVYTYDVCAAMHILKLHQLVVYPMCYLYLISHYTYSSEHVCMLTL